MRLKSLIAAAALASATFFGVSAANAAIIGFNSVFDGGAGTGTLIDNANPLHYTHNINGQINIATDTITIANLSIKLSDPNGGSEAFTVTLDAVAQNQGNVGDVGFTFFSFDTGSSILTLAMLQVDGILDVTLSVGAGQSVNFLRSDLSGFATTPVPEPATLAVLGMGLLGLGAIRRRKAA